MLLLLLLLRLLLLLLLLLLLWWWWLLWVRCYRSVGPRNVGVRGGGTGANILVEDHDLESVLASSKCGIRSRQQYAGGGGVYPGVS